MNERIGFIGLGNMGAPMAANLLAAGFPLTVFNRSPGKAATLGTAGATIAEAPADLASAGGIVITMVADDAALEAVTLGDDGVLPRLAPGGLHISMSTVAPATARRLAALHQAQGVDYLAAPVFGRPEAAAAAKLWIPCSGPPAARRRAAPLLEAMGQGVIDFGDDPGAANVVKLAGNFMIVSAIEAIAEACVLADKSGVDRGRLMELLVGSIFDCPVYRTYGTGIGGRNYEPPGFRLSLGLKDVKLILGAAEETTTPMPLASLLRDRITASLAKGWGEKDWMAIDHDVADNAGLDRSS